MLVGWPHSEVARSSINVRRQQARRSTFAPNDAVQTAVVGPRILKRHGECWNYETASGRLASIVSHAEYAVSNVARSRLKIARFNDLNDPFELYAQDSDNGRTRRRLAEHKQGWNATHGLLCFSADWKDPVLWSHYGKRHQGICLGYDVEEGLAKPVIYRNERLRDDQPLEDFDDLMLFTKFKSWEYENEWRVLATLEGAQEEAGLHFCSTGDKIKLREVILGSLCDQDLDHIRSIVAAHHPEAFTFRARLAYKYFSIVPDLPTVRGLPGWGTPFA